MSILSSFFDERYPGFDGSNIALMNWKETPNAHIFEFDLPGVPKDDVKLELHDGHILRLRAEKKDEEFDTKEERWHCKERVHGGFARQFRLPRDAKVGDIKASISNGVLVVIVPKDHHITKNIKDVKKQHQRHREVHISGGVDENDSHGSKGFGKFVCCKA